MRGRTIYFQGRRILVFCGEKKNKPHSTNDRFGNANAEIPVGENTETKNTASEFGESDGAAELGNNDDSIVTTTNARPQVGDNAEVGQKINASPTATILGENKSGAEINQRINGAALILRNGKAKTGIAVGENTETLTGSNPMFGAAAEDISAGHKADTFTASGIKRDSAAAGLFIGENIASKKYTFLTASVKSGISTAQNVKAYVDTGTTVKSGWYTTQDDISPVETFKIALPIFFIYSVSGTWTEFIASHVENANISGLGYRLSLNVPNSGGWTNRIVASVGYTNGVPYWKFNSYLQNSKFMVTQDTELSQEDIEVFNRNFKFLTA